MTKPKVVKNEGALNKTKKNSKFKKKKENGAMKQPKTYSIVPPKIKNLQKENISSNWKNLLQIIPKKSETIETIEKVPVRNLQAEARIQRKKRKAELLRRKNSGENKSEGGGEKQDIWFDDVDEILLAGETDVSKVAEKALVKERSFTGLTKVVGMDCEMVGVGAGGEESILARVSIVNHFGNTLLDTFVAPTERVTDYRTAVSGVRPEDIKNAPDFKSVQLKVSEVLKGRVLVGHALSHDMKVLFLDHPKRMIRDTSKFKKFRDAFGGKTPSLKNLSSRFLGVTVQTGEHSSVQDAQAAVRLYTMYRNEWESGLTAKRGTFVGKGKKKKKNELNNKSLSLVGIQRGLAESGTSRYVDSDSD